MKKNPFAVAEGKRVKITNRQRKQITNLYNSAVNDIKKEVRLLKNKDNISSTMKKIYLDDLKEQINDRINKIDKDVEIIIRSGMKEVSIAVFEDNQKFLNDIGFSINAKNFYIANDIVNEVATGKLYEGRWSLSRAIWTDNKKKLKDINSIVAKGIIEQKSTYDIAKDLEKYVNPKAKKDWNWSKVYPGTNKVIDYNAQRLARTMVSHAYQESFVRSTIQNPFIEAYKWLASGTDRMCAICEERDGQIYSKEDLPLDHPNGMCTFAIVMEKSYEQVANDIANWVNNTGDKNLNDDIDTFVNNLYNRGLLDLNPTIINKKIF